MDNIHKTFRKIFSIKGPEEAKILSINESISIHKLSKLKIIWTILMFFLDAFTQITEIQF